MTLQKAELMSQCKLILGDFFELWPTIHPKSVEVVLTDMPYNILGPAGQDWNKWMDLNQLEEIFSSILSATGWVIMTCNFSLMMRLIEVFQKKLEFSHYHIWKKSGSVMPINAYLPLPDSEFILVFKQKGAKRSDLPFFPRRALEPKTPYIKRNNITTVPTRRQIKSAINQSDSSRHVKTILEAPAKPNMPKAERSSHPTQKSLQLLIQLIVTYSEPGSMICDPFAGSGSTLIAAHRLNRNSLGYEIEQKFYQEAKDRIEKATAQQEVFRISG